MTMLEREELAYAKYEALNQQRFAAKARLQSLPSSAVDERNVVKEQLKKLEQQLAAADNVPRPPRKQSKKTKQTDDSDDDDDDNVGSNSAKKPKRVARITLQLPKGWDKNAPIDCASCNREFSNWVGFTNHWHSRHPDEPAPDFGGGETSSNEDDDVPAATN